MTLQLLPSVFHPRLYLTTETLLNFLLSIDLKGKSTLELGCGSAAISLFLSKFNEVNAHVSDINPSAIKGVQINSLTHQVDIISYYSNLFNDIPKTTFDVVILNPPFYNSSIKSIDEYAFNTGENFIYFKNLVTQLIERRHSIGIIYMILTKNSALDCILSHFGTLDFVISKVHEEKVHNESLLIFSISMI